MRRPVLISLCIFNSLIAGGLLSYVILSTFEKRTDQRLPPKAQPANALSDEARWLQAQEAYNAQIAYSLLAQIQDRPFLAGKIESEFDQLRAESTKLVPNSWPFYQALIQIYSESAKQPSEIRILSQLARNPERPIALRDAAFRAAIQCWLQSGQSESATDSIWLLIDHFSEAPSSLRGTALLAESFLENQVGLSPSRKTAHRARLRRTFDDETCQDSVRSIALNLLVDSSQITGVELERVYPTSSEALQTAILQAMAQSPGIPHSDWLMHVSPKTPEQERFLYQIRQVD